ncbi:MAG: CoA pyrophosphatase [Acidimicrobiales bacterium]
MIGRGGDQIIPRPPGAQPGGPAPWAALDQEQRRGLSIERVLASLSEHAAPTTRVPDVFLEADNADGVAAPEGAGTRVPAAVLVALFEESGEARVILTRRSGELRHHKGEVSFPGGRLETGETLVECALREAHEETGLDPASVSVVGQLSSLLTLSSTSLITPIVGVIPLRPTLVGSPAEVARVFDVSLAELCSDDVFREEKWSLRSRGGEVPAGIRLPDLPGDGSFPVWFFELPGETVWGATARVLVELLRTVLGV